MQRWLLASSVALIAACAGNPAPTTIPPSGPIRQDRLDVPGSLDVLWVGQEVAGKEGGGFRSFFNVYGQHRTTGQRYLLVYERTKDGSKLVNIVTITDGLDERLLHQADTLST
jgi:hypothetical protein